MTKTILLGASFLALLAAYPAFAADTKADADVSAKAKVEAKMDKAGDVIKEKTDKAEASIKRNADKAEAATKDAYNDVKAYFNEKTKNGEPVDINARLTADELIGATVENPKGENIGEIKDILISKNGDAETVIISDNKLGLGGKLAAFDYDVIEGITPDKDVVVKLSEAQIDAAKRFEYEAKDADAKTMVMPAGQFSVKKITDAKVVDASGKTVADVDTVAFEGDDADYVIVTFNKILGMGGDKAALNIDALDLAEKNGKYQFTLTQDQTAQFESAKKTSKTY